MALAGRETAVGELLRPLSREFKPGLSRTGALDLYVTLTVPEIFTGLLIIGAEMDLSNHLSILWLQHCSRTVGEEASRVWRGRNIERDMFELCMEWWTPGNSNLEHSM